jgi:hypothetical protein
MLDPVAAQGTAIILSSERNRSRFSSQSLFQKLNPVDPLRKKNGCIVTGGVLWFVLGCIFSTLGLFLGLTFLKIKFRTAMEMKKTQMIKDSRAVLFCSPKNGGPVHLCVFKEYHLQLKNQTSPQKRKEKNRKMDLQEKALNTTKHGPKTGGRLEGVTKYQWVPVASRCQFSISNFPHKTEMLSHARSSVLVYEIQFSHLSCLKKEHV